MVSLPLARIRERLFSFTEWIGGVIHLHLHVSLLHPLHNVSVTRCGSNSLTSVLVAQILLHSDNKLVGDLFRRFHYDQMRMKCIHDKVNCVLQRSPTPQQRCLRQWTWQTRCFWPSPAWCSSPAATSSATTTSRYGSNGEYSAESNLRLGLGCRN